MQKIICKTLNLYIPLHITCLAHNNMSIIPIKKDVPSADIASVNKMVTVTQIINYFTASLAKPGNYPRCARRYVEFCLDNNYGIDLISLRLFAAGKNKTQLSPARKFLTYYYLTNPGRIIPDPPQRQLILPAANELILGYLSEAAHLRGDHSKENYRKSLNQFFQFLEAERQANRPGTFAAVVVNSYIENLRTNRLSPFTINFYLSTIKQLAAWVIKHRTRFNLDSEQIGTLQDIDAIRGLRVERGFYKDSLTVQERDELLTTVHDPTDQAILSLLAIEGLRTVEVTRLLVKDIDFDNHLLWVLGKGKTTKKAIRLFNQCAESLRHYLQDSGWWPTTAHQSKKLFPEMQTYHIRYRVDKAMKSIGLKRQHLSAHSLRHTAGQLLLDQGIEPLDVQRHLRHESFETTQLYIKKKTEQLYFERMPK